MKLQEAAVLVAKALRKATEEHGRPNHFSCGELHSHYGAPSALITGRVGAMRVVELWRALGGRERWGSCPAYSAGCFFV